MDNETKRQKEYGEQVKQVTPTHNLWMNLLKAFVVGGGICVVGQVILNMLRDAGVEDKNAYTWLSVILIMISVLMTGFNVYPSLAAFGGAGALVPITGFANGVASSAIEFKSEGQVFGIGCKIFTIAGPVILYGIFTSWVLGLGYWVLKMLQIV